jgi:endonuclease/exonuclease/phosphatase family metal-dependent hydrolase
VYDYTLIPGFLDMNRGFAWLDMTVGSQTVRVVTTHVEAFYYDNLQPYSIRQVQQLIHDLGTTTSALIVMGDFNNDPHDPIPVDQYNTGGRLVASSACPQQVSPLTLETARAACNAYWMMRQAGYTDVGPDALQGQFNTWGYDADLAGPAGDRLFESELHTTARGLTARLDYIFVRNGATAQTAHIIGNDWPEHGWPCVYAMQRQNAQALASRLNLPFHAAHACAPSDHAGVFATILIADSLVQEQIPPRHIAHLYAYIALFLGGLCILWLRVRKRTSRQH